MALYFENQTTLKPGTRSNSKLVVSGGLSPGEHWLTDPNLPKLFDFEYGGDGQREVAIAKGMIVAAGSRIQSFERGGKKVGTLTIANGANKPVGMAPFNFSVYKPNGYFNLPSIITREYVELPLFPNAADAAAVKWGAVHGNINPGDMLMVSPTNPGQITVWDGQLTTITQIVGQALAVEDDIEPWGWMKWAMFPETAKYQDAEAPGINYQQKPNPAPDAYGYPYDPEYRNGIFDNDAYLNPYNTNPTGIRGLHDGINKSQVVQQKDIIVPANTTAGTKLVVNLERKNIVQGSVSVTFGAQERPATEYEVDYSNGVVVFTVPATLAGNAAVQTGQIKFRSLFAGTPAGWDWAGAVGAVRLLLKF